MKQAWICYLFVWAGILAFMVDKAATDENANPTSTSYQNGTGEGTRKEKGNRKVEEKVSNVTTISRNKTSQCVSTFLGKRRCLPYNGTQCKDVMKAQNRTLLSLNCSLSLSRAEEILVNLAVSMRTTYKASEDCLLGARWVLCELNFPDCDQYQPLKTVICREACQLIRDDLCTTQWQAVNSLSAGGILSSDVVIPRCELFPSKSDKRQQCSYPQVLVDLIKKKDSKMRLILILAGAGAGVLFFIILICAVICCRRRKIHEKSPKIPSQDSTEHLHMNSVDTSTGSLRPFSYSFEDSKFANDNPLYSTQNDLMTELNIPEFPRDKLVFIEDLGEGAFGKVVKCEALGLGSDPKERMITAVKYLKSEATDQMRMNFRREVQTLASFNHINIVKILGVCTDDRGPPCMILEYMEHGDLAKFIRERAGTYHAGFGRNGVLPDDLEYQAPALTFRHLIYIAKQIASGMSFLSKRRFVHRDLATRNNLVGEKMIVKIADFGLAQDIYASDYYRIDGHKLLPIRWLPPEALTLGKFTVESDIWSYGILLWELFTFGMQPYPGLSNDEVCERIRCFKLLSCPDGCPSEVYDLIRLCWKYQPEKRLPFSKIYETLDNWLEKRSPFIEAAWEKMLAPPKAERPPTLPEKRTKPVFYR